MAIVDLSLSKSADFETPLPRSKTRTRLNRIREVREVQGVTLRTVARHLGRDVRTLRNQEEEGADLRLSELYDWQKVLDVPVADLLVDDNGPLSRPVQERAQMLRVMKTAMSLLELSPNTTMKRLSQNLVEQLSALMPELKEVSAWHSVGQRRSADELGRIAENCVSANELPGDFGND
jgi:transcriptional regulator with XRE-family HTH domain